MLSRSQRKRIELVARGRDPEGLHLLEGPKAIQDALGAGVVEELWLRSDVEAGLRASLEARASEHGVVLREGARADFDRLTRTVTPQGVLALVRDTAADLDHVLATCAAGKGLLVWLDGVQDPGNVGAVVRVAAGLGAKGLLVGEGSADPLGLKALRASAGLALRLPFARAPAAAIAAGLEAVRVPVWILDRDGDDLLAVSDPPACMALVVGAEGRGVGTEARASAARAVGIPLAPGVDSLNAAVAAGIGVAHLTRGPAGRPAKEDA